MRAAHVVGEDASNDVALLAFDPKGLTLRPISLGTIRSLRVGDPVYMVGDPFGFRRSLSQGVVSALDRTIEAPNGFTVAHAIQTDAAMNPGSSGGPMLDARGRQIGFADQIAIGSSGATASTGVGFAVAIDAFRGALPQLERGVAPVHAYIGASLSDGSVAGALVSSVTAGGPAARAGLRRGDVVIRFAATGIAGAGDLVAAVAARHPGDRIAIVALRNGTRLTLTLRLGRQPSSAGSGR
jgi:S1-C subfamily serine protease